MVDVCTNERAFFCLGLIWDVAWNREMLWGGAGIVVDDGRGGRAVMLS